MGERLPAMLTIAEAGALLRIGRTKAYAMADEWRRTGGRSGLPVVDLGNVLRVPRQALEDLLGIDLDGQIDPGAMHPKPAARPAPLAPAPAPAASRPRKSRRAASSQAHLFDAAAGE